MSFALNVGAVHQCQGGSRYKATSQSSHSLSVTAFGSGSEFILARALLLSVVCFYLFQLLISVLTMKDCLLNRSIFGFCLFSGSISLVLVSRNVRWELQSDLLLKEATLHVMMTEVLPAAAADKVLFSF